MIHALGWTKKKKVPLRQIKHRNNKHGAKICFRHNLNKGIREIIKYGAYVQFP